MDNLRRLAAARARHRSRPAPTSRDRRGGRGRRPSARGAGLRARLGRSPAHSRNRRIRAPRRRAARPRASVTLSSWCKRRDAVEDQIGDGRRQAPSRARRATGARGAEAMPRPIASICCSPPDKRAGHLPPPLGQHRKQRKDAVEVARPNRAGRAPRRRPFRDFRERSARRRPAGLPARGRCRDGRARAAGSASRSRPSKAILPAAGVTVPEIALNSVVLPAPLGPTIATNCPSATVSDTPRSAASPP